MRIVDFDLETDPFGPYNLAPEPICLALADTDGSRLLVASCEPLFDEVVDSILTDYDLITNTNIAFDMAVLLAHRPKFAQLIWKAYDQNKITSIDIREKLLYLATTGDLRFVTGENGAQMPLGFSQADMEKRRLGIDRSDDKEGDNAVRSNYGPLRGKPTSEYPERMRAYPIADADGGLRIHLAQDEDEKKLGLHALKTQFLQTRAALALYLGSCWGMRIDKPLAEQKLHDLRAKFAPHATVEDEDGTSRLAYGNMLAAGILRPGEPIKPYVKQEEKAVAALGFRPADWEPHREKLEALGIKFKAAVEPSINETVARQYVTDLCERLGVEKRLTDSGAVSIGEEMMTDLKGLDDTIDEMIARNEIKMLVTTQLPALTHDRIHPKYDVLKATGRTGARGNKKTDKAPPYPSFNIQNPDKRIRDIFIADEGCVICSVDYNFIELVTTAQQCIDLFGQSVLADKINAGMDPHAYLAASLLVMTNPTWDTGNPDGNYEKFVKLKKDDRKTYDHWRTMAKPTGLGLPGGLGALTFIAYAKTTFGVNLVKQEGSLDAAVALSKKLKETWLRTYPEFRAYFQYINSMCVDPEWSDGENTRYAYTTPNGLIRRNCAYTEAANGLALQSRTAEGAKIALFSLARKCYDASLGHVLYGCRNPAFIHDEVLVSIPNDDLMHERAFAVADVMVEGMRTVSPNVKVGAEPAVMLRWNKKAEKVLGPDGRLRIWTPS